MKNIKMIDSLSHKRVIQFARSRKFSVNRKKRPVPIEELNSNLQQQSQNELSRIVRPYYEIQEPVLIRNFIDGGTPAIHRWKDLDYLCDKVGYNTPCSVEIGGSYNSNIARNEILFGEYIAYMNLFHEQYGSTSKGTGENDNRPQSEELVYMAQNHLFPSLKDDFTMPDLVGSMSKLKTKSSDSCGFRNSRNIVGHGHVYSTMIWFGPSHCISPLHYDPLDNLLMGFVGKKKIVLFPKDQNDGDDYNRTYSSDDSKSEKTKWHYAGYNGQQYNTSPVDICNPDYKLYPNFENVPQAW
eukprot:CAMPEP_0203680274 /NCGR_PEP_ID=MMETSP0090-20130426/38595_1 /ASSEMBLY_ACC=CAM_ASM_001088 /TAXON_ID=426623 /ORGANISM="Chaetoceros affinis, Strain CCMP159" /LENGTH=296 /DNA_ID=CAMNT_0050548269 /DNA_START=57 /DNA_END=944 /DNA_ORIENTATION=-